MIAKVLSLSLFATHAQSRHPVRWEVDTSTSCYGKETGYKSCNTDPCPPAVQCQPQDCVLAEWGEWSSSDCTGLCERERSVATHNNECGTPCNGSLIETKRCDTPCHKDPVPCELSEWSKWGDCPAGVGPDGLSLSQECRERSVVSIEQFGGKPCHGELKETQPKPVAEEIPCEYEIWGAWEKCSTECGSQTTRSRKIKQVAKHGGARCTSTLNETRPCTESEGTVCPDSIDCEWNDWTAWSGCTCTCDGGQKTRDRRIKTAPRGQGKLCKPSARTQIKGCNTQPCNVTVCEPINGEFGAWGGWGKCTATCGGGVQWRKRPIAVSANDCGTPALGDDKEYQACGTKSCTESADCVLGSWSEWSDCSCECNGVKRRGRVIESYGKGEGLWCEGSLKDIEPCNVNATACPDKTIPTPPPENCEMGDWVQSTCSVTCGTGTAVKTKAIIKQGANGGKMCSGALSKAVQCVKPKCFVPTVEPGTDCTWGDWSDWGECDKCGGQRKRNRHIDQMPENGGTPCEANASEEVGKCDRQCHDIFYCKWGAWKEHGTCSKSCGNGSIKVVRYLTAEKVTSDSLTSLSDIEETIGDTNDQKAPELFLSFACGSLVTFAAVGIALRATRRSEYGRTAQHDAVFERTVPMVSVE